MEGPFERIKFSTGTCLGLVVAVVIFLWFSKENKSDESVAVNVIWKTMNLNSIIFRSSLISIIALFSLCLSLRSPSDFPPFFQFSLMGYFLFYLSCLNAVIIFEIASLAAKLLQHQHHFQISRKHLKKSLFDWKRENPAFVD